MTFHTAYGSSTGWNLNEMNEGHQRPLKSVGTVLLNGILSEEDAAVASTSSSTPVLFPLATGVHAASVSEVRQGEIVYRFIGQASHGARTMRDGRITDNTSVAGLTSLCGQGWAGETAEALARRIQVDGIVENGTNNSKTRRWNTLIGGVHTVRNNSIWPIAAGDRLIAHVPSPAEVAQARKDPGAYRRTEAEIEGDVRLWYKPYEPALHRAQLRPMYRALTGPTSHATEQHERGYVRQCNALFDAACGISLVVIGKMWPHIASIMTPGGPGPAPTAAQLKQMLDAMGYQTHLDKPGAKPVAMRGTLIDALFASVSQYENPAENPKLAPNDTSDEAVIVNRAQTDAMAIYLVETAQFIEELTNRIIGQAKTPARPGQDFSLELCNYSKRG